MNKTQLNELMDKTLAYHNAYLNKYNKTNSGSETINSGKMDKTLALHSFLP